MKYLSNKNGFLGIDNKFSFKEKVVVVPFGLEKTVSYGGGTRNGPKEIIKASHQVELYDEELNCEPFKKIGIKTLKPFKIEKNVKKALCVMSKINQEILGKKLFRDALHLLLKNLRIFVFCTLMLMQIYEIVIMEKNFHMHLQFEDV